MSSDSNERLNNAPTRGDEFQPEDSPGDRLFDGIPLINTAEFFELEIPVRDGGMGTVTKAKLKGLDRFVALKRMQPEFRSQLVYQHRFVQEARAVARLKHPNIVDITGFYRDVNGPILVLEFVPGRDLETVVHQNGALPPDEMARIAIEICKALECAHSQNIIHRDVKPANVLLSVDGHVKLTDFGLVRNIDSHIRISQTGTTLGSLRYMAPEQRDNASKADARSDLWSLSACLYHLLTGLDPPVSMHFEFDRIPNHFLPILQRGLQPFPQHRFQSASEFREAVETLGRIHHASGPVEVAILDDGQCRRCRAINPLERKYCRKCGSPLHEPCLSCGIEIGVWEQFCPQCPTSQNQRYKEMCQQIVAAQTRAETLLSQENFSQAIALLTQLPQQYSHPRLSDQLKWIPATIEKASQLQLASRILELETAFEHAADTSSVADMDRSLRALLELEPNAERRTEFQKHLERTVRSIHLKAKEIAEQQNDYAAAAELLEEIPDHLRIGRLYNQILERRNRVLELEQKIQSGFAAKDWTDLKASAEELQKFQPKSTDVKNVILQAIAGLAASRPAMLKAPFNARTAARAQEDWARYLGISVEMTNSLGMKFRVIPPGTFEMGSPTSEAKWSGAEALHKVTITQPKLLGVYPVTQAEWTRLMGSNPSHFTSVSGQDSSRFPVECVNWDDCQEFLKKLNAQHTLQGWHYRLPTEAEWEYSCRAGTVTPFWFGSELNGKQANCGGTYPYPENAAKGPYLNRPSVVGSYGANPFGLYDQHGNVWEWCEDWYGNYDTSATDDPAGPSSGSSRVLRGGSWGNNAYSCRSALRFNLEPSRRRDAIGFRVLCELS